MNFNLFKWVAVSLAAVACAGIIAVGPAHSAPAQQPVTMDEVCGARAVGAGIAQDMLQEGLYLDEMLEWFVATLGPMVESGELPLVLADSMIQGLAFVLENVPRNLDPGYVASATYHDCVRGNA